MISTNPVNGSGKRLARDYDAELVARFKSGDERAFAEMVRRHRVSVYAMVYCIIRNREDADEVTSDTFIRAYRGLANFRGDSSLRTWLYQIAANLSRNRYWYWWRRKRSWWVSLQAPISEDNATTLSDAIQGDAMDALGEAEINELVAIVSSGMEELNDAQREIMILRCVQHLTYGEISEVLGISIGTVKSRIARARESLRLAIADASEEEIVI